MKLRPKALKAAREYAGALIDACAPAGVDPVDVLIDTEAFPRIVKGLPMIEFIVGWFRGVEDTHDTTARELWAYVSDGIEPSEISRRSKPGSKPSTSPKRKQIGAGKVPDMPALKRLPAGSR